MSAPVVALFAMPDRNHFQLLCPIVAGLAERGATAHVFTHRDFAGDVEQAGGEFVDLFTARPVASADSESRPLSCRYVTYAAHYAQDVARDLRSIGPSLVISDTFAVIGRVVALMLGLPYVNVVPGHYPDPARVAEELRADLPVSLSPRCLRAVDTLRDDYGIEDASPFSYISGVSPFLNVHCEPSQFMTAAERRAAEPAAFFGSLPVGCAALTGRDSAPPAEPGVVDLAVYVSLGTIIWRYWTAEALEALTAIARAIAATRGASATISLGGAEVSDDHLRALRQPNVRIERYVDGWRALGQANAFITHQGTSSTQEAIFSRVPMISYPFFGDQPALSERCASLGLSTPLVRRPRAPVTEADVHAALGRLQEHRRPMRTALERAREWELGTLAGRGAVIDRILGLAGANGG